MSFYCKNCGNNSMFQLYECPICQEQNSYVRDSSSSRSSIFPIENSIEKELVQDLIHIQDSEKDIPSKQKGQRLERFLRNLFQVSGFSVTDNHKTGDATDGGIDFFIKKNRITYCVQAKHRHLLSSELIGAETVQKLVGAIAQYEKENNLNDEKLIGVLITTHFFTTHAIQAAKQLNIILVDKQTLISIVLELQPEILAAAYYATMTEQLKRCPDCGELMVVKKSTKNQGRYWAHPEYKEKNSHGCDRKIDIPRFK